MKKIDLVGWRFGRLVVISFSHRDINRYYWNCLCDCGVKIIIDRGNLRSGTSKSCGCYKKELDTSHNLSRTKFYHVFYGIKERCNNPNSPNYKHYGGRGIKCLWESFEEFRKDMFDSYQLGLTIDRTDNGGNYSKSNCRWVTHRVNCNNKTRQKPINMVV